MSQRPCSTQRRAAQTSRSAPEMAEFLLLGFGVVWRSPDGSEVLALQQLDHYGNFAVVRDADDGEERVKRILERFGPALERASVGDVRAHSARKQEAESTCAQQAGTEQRSHLSPAQRRRVLTLGHRDRPRAGSAAIRLCRAGRRPYRSDLQENFSAVGNRCSRMRCA